MNDLLEAAANGNASRRQFMTTNAALLTALLLPAGAVRAQQAAEGEAPATPEFDPSITADTIAEAQKLLGIEFTEAERATIAETVVDNIETFKQRRAIDLPNELGPLTTFRLDPALAQRTPSSNSVSVSSTPGALPSTDEDIAYAPVTHLSHWLQSGAITSERLTNIYLSRIRRIAPTLECVVTTTEELALAQAKRADSEIAASNIRSPLHGVPYGAKDLFDTKDIRTSWGAEPYKDRVATRDAEVVKKLETAGAVLVAKTTLGALAYGDIWFGGTTKNPFNLEQGSSGSSAGSASGTAAGLYGFSLGTETLGSIVSPTMRCGSTGLRPTFGRVSRTGAMALCWSLDKIGPICRSVQDCTLVLDAINGATDDDPSSVDAPLNCDTTQCVKGMRVGYSPSWFEGEGADDIDRGSLEAVKSLGAEMVEIDIPDWPYSLLFGILVAEAAAAFEEITLDNIDDSMKWQADNAWPNTFRSTWFMPAIEFIQAERFRRKVARMMDDKLKGVDVVFGPSFAGSLLVITNFTGHPQLCLRAGFRDDGTPKGVSIWGHLFDEGSVCRLGAALERELNVAHKRPTL